MTTKKLVYVTHPEVIVDPDRTVTDWYLSDIGIERMRNFATSEVFQNADCIWSSDETKAIEASGFLAATLKVPVKIDRRLHENDRSSTGFIPPQEFELVADEFFKYPLQSTKGWETAVDAQSRITEATFDLISKNAASSRLVMMGHGGVGTLLYCALTKSPISRDLDQPNQGCYWTYDITNEVMDHGWTSF